MRWECEENEEFEHIYVLVPTRSDNPYPLSTVCHNFPRNFLVE